MIAIQLPPWWLDESHMQRFQVMARSFGLAGDHFEDTIALYITSALYRPEWDRLCLIGGGRQNGPYFCWEQLVNSVGVQSSEGYLLRLAASLSRGPYEMTPGEAWDHVRNEHQDLVEGAYFIHCQIYETDAELSVPPLRRVGAVCRAKWDLIDEGHNDPTDEEIAERVNLNTRAIRE